MNTKLEFLKKLQGVLLWKYNTQETYQILKDYEEYFDLGLQDGKSEWELCKELGSPLAVLRSLEEEETSLYHRHFFTKKTLLRNFFALLLLFTMILLLSSLQNASYFRIVISLYVPLFLVGTWFLLGGNYFSLGYLSLQTSSFSPKKWILPHIGLFLLALISFVMMAVLGSSFDQVRSFLVSISFDLAYVGPLTTKILLLVCVLVLALALWALYQYRTLSSYFFSIVCHCAAILGMNLSFYNLLRTTDTVTSYFLHLFQSLIPYALGISLACFFALSCKKATKEVPLWTRN